MRAVISSGHGKYIRGASGSPIPPYLDEVDEARKVVEEVAEVLRSMDVEVVTYHDDVSDTQSENLDRIVDFHNAQSRDWDFSVHFNAYETTSKPMGCEVLYASSTGEQMARKIVDAICAASGLINRGPKHRGDLAFLNGTECPACLLEVCFVDSTADADIYQSKFNAICDAIAEAISGEEAGELPDRPERPDRPEPEPPEPPVVPPLVPPIGELPDTLPPPNQRRVLKKGMSGQDVAIVQRVLGVQADGHFGSITHTQVEAFQAASELDSDGIIGPDTWGEIDTLYRSMKRGTEGLTEDLTAEIVELAHDSPLQEYSWPDRGPAAPGYLTGMALCYAVALQRLRDEDPAVMAMATANEGDGDTDALVWLEEELDDIGCHSDSDGIATLRTLFVLMIGLGVRESSGQYFCGRDMSASNVEPDTAEAGAWQTSWNIASADSSIPPLLVEFMRDPNGFHGEFREGISPDAADLDCYGSGDGASYQFLAKYSPLFAAFVTAVGLRTRRQHWGPVNRREVTLKREAVDLLKDVERLVLSDL